MNITSRQLKAFLLTARHKSFSRAAEQLFITQSGMSVLVRELESQLGFRLFERTTRKVTLTEFGTRFLPIADRSLLELESAAANIGRSASAADGWLSVGAAPLVAAEVLAPAIAAYTQRNAQQHVRLIDAAGSRLMEMVQSGEIDAALTAFCDGALGVQRTPLLRYSLMLISALGAGDCLPPQLRWSDIARCTLVGFPRDYPIQQLIDGHLERAGRRVPPEAVCNFLETQIAMVEAGAGIGVIPSYAAPACMKRRISMHALVDPVVSGHLHWVASRARKPPRMADAFSAFLRDYLSELAERWPPDSAQAA